jgi:hypothetical protein
MRNLTNYELCNIKGGYSIDVKSILEFMQDCNRRCVYLNNESKKMKEAGDKIKNRAKNS